MCKYCDAQVGDANDLDSCYMAIGKNPHGLLFGVYLFSDEFPANIRFNCFEDGYDDPVASITIPIHYCPGCGRKL